MHCIKCNKPLPDGALFCPFCGKKQVKEKRKALKRANGTGTVYKLSGTRKKPWIAAKNKIVIGYYEKKTEALQALERTSLETITEKYNMTFAEVYTSWKNEHFPKLNESGKKAYELSYKVFVSLHDKKFRTLRTSDFQKIVNEHKDKPEAIKKYRQLISQMSKWAMREDLINKNYAQFLELPQSPKELKHERVPFTAEEIQKIQNDNSETAKIVIMLLTTGMRIGELFKLPCKNYFKDYVIGGSKTEAGRNRIIPIAPEGRNAFEYFFNKATGPLILSGYDGQHRVDNFRKRDYAPLLERLEIPYKVPYVTRHTYSSNAIRAGMKKEDLQKILGHTDYATTVNNYSHATPDELVKAVEDASVTNTLLTNSNIPEKTNPQNR